IDAVSSASKKSQADVPGLTADLKRSEDLLSALNLSATSASSASIKALTAAGQALAAANLTPTERSALEKRLVQDAADLGQLKAAWTAAQGADVQVAAANQAAAMKTLADADALTKQLDDPISKAQ